MFVLVALLLVLSTRCASPLNKCCDRDSRLTKNNSTYVCDRDEDKRVQIFTEDTNFFKNNADGECFDVDGNIVEYKYRNWTIVEKKEVHADFYYKCCPLGYFYNSVTHSCAEKKQNEEFITEKFISVGLPQCKVIVDYKLTPGRYRLDLRNLYIDDQSVTFRDGQFCIDRDQDEGMVVRGCYDDLSVCYTTRCVRKCCPDGQSFVGGPQCKNTYVHGLNLSFSDRINNSQDPFAIMHGYNCRIYILKKKIQFFLNTDGTLYAFSNKSSSYLQYPIDKEKSYCIEHTTTKTLNNFEFFMCFADEPLRTKFVVARWAKIFSCVFIVATMVVYILLPEMLNLFGKILLSYCMSVLALFLILIYTQFETKINDKTCVATSLLSSYMSLSSFTWLNIMCFDIWWTFGTPKSYVSTTQKRSEVKKFVLYSLYGWGIPASLTLIAFLAYEIFDTPYVVRPFMGAFHCFWERRSGNYGMFLFYSMPLIFMEIANLVFFVKTIVYCLKIKSEINRMNDNRISVKGRKKYYNLDKEQLILILKLSVTMGISFVFEVVSSLVDFSANSQTEYVEIIWDTINCLQGVYVFLIFVCKAKVLSLCKNKITWSRDRKISVSSIPTTSTQISIPLSSKNKLRDV